VLVRLAAALLTALVLETAAAAQEPPQTGEIFGRVVDEDGGALPGATVEWQRLDGARGSVVVLSDGTYRLSNLSRGIYRLDFSLAGIVQPLTHAGIVLLPGEKLELNVRLRYVPGVVVHKDDVGDAGLMPGEVLVRLETPHGTIDLAIDTARAPITAANFLKYVDGGFYDGGRFHRATRKDNYTPDPPDRPMMEIIQGGINPARRGEAFPPIPLERTSVTGLRHVRGTLSMARAAGADTARSDFFILLDDQPSLDFGGRRFEDGQGGAAFGRVVAGLDVVRTIQQQPVQAQALTPPVPILKAARVK
jgi:peptidyl-prolyl cis-trans isomerase A (cyclophilin A)